MGIETIGRGSRSLLAFLDITSQGIGPDKLQPNVQTVVDALTFIGETTTRVVQTQVTMNAGIADDTISMAVPAGHIWVVREAGAFAQFSAADVAAAVESLRINLLVTGFSNTTGGNGVAPVLAYGMENVVARTATAISVGATNNVKLPISHLFTPPLICGDGIVFTAVTGTKVASTTAGELFVWALINDIPIA